jgi:ComF family protein
MTLSTSWLEDLLSLLYPNLCPACGESPPMPKDIICLQCERKLPQTQFHLEKENAFTERFWGRLQLNSGAAMLHFVKGGRTQRLIHQLKYKGRKDIGVELGKRYGRKLKKSPLFLSVDLIVPVPLHTRKFRLRGYNQAATFAEGLSESMEIPMLEDGLKRISYARSQTEKSRIERLENVMSAFEISAPKKLSGKHILLVDDVLTTGATLESCGIKILDLEDTKLSMATIGISD